MGTKAAGRENRRDSVPATEPVLGFDSPHELLAAEAEAQWGMFTTAQALRAGMTRKALAHLVARHHVNHTGTRGVYRFVGVPEEPMLDQVRRDWLALSPKRFKRERLRTLGDEHTWNDAVVSHLTAANYVYELSDLQPDMCDFTVDTKSRRVRNPSIAFHPRLTKPQWELVNGLPTTTIPQTVADLYIANENQDHLGKIIYDAILRRGRACATSPPPWTRRPPTTAGKPPFAYSS